MRLIKVTNLNCFRLELPRLQYTVCTDGSLVDLYSVQQGKSFWDGHKDSDLKVTEPVGNRLDFL